MKVLVFAVLLLVSGKVCLAQSAGCGITHALDTYYASSQTYVDAQIAAKVILTNGLADPPYSLCGVLELKRADRFMNVLIDFILSNGDTLEHQAKPVAAGRDEQKAMRAEIKRQTEATTQ
jgi:hypothetical protein